MVDKEISEEKVVDQALGKITRLKSSWRLQGKRRYL